mgnify:CR=1 FL=1|tara:strand:+ start:154 stop:390 length:237 start_codon:yes stop_codon:yes gene_type:complete
MRRGDLIRIRYYQGHNDMNDPLWSEPVTGMLVKLDVNKSAGTQYAIVHEFWCIEKRRMMRFMPKTDEAEVIYEVNAGN